MHVFLIMQLFFMSIIPLEKNIYRTEIGDDWLLGIGLGNL